MTELMFNSFNYNEKLLLIIDNLQLYTFENIVVNH